jgi:hypothetical protein
VESRLAACCNRAVIEQKNFARVVHKNFSGHVSVFLRAQVWLAEREYNSGNLTVHNGSLWCAQERTKSRPGADSSWQLYVKQGTFSK